MNNDIVGFWETQINPWVYTCKIIETLNFLIINLYKNENKFLNLAYTCRNDVSVLDKFDTNGVPIFSFKKNGFQSIHTNVILQKAILQDEKLSQLMQYLPAANSIDIITEDFNYDLLKVTEYKLLDILTDHVKIVNKSKHICGSLIGHAHIKNTLMEDFSIHVTVENVYFGSWCFKNCNWENCFWFSYWFSIKCSTVRQ